MGAQMDSVVAGSALSEEEAQRLTLPNTPPFVCGLFVGPNSDADAPENTPVVHLLDAFESVAAQEMYGYAVCEESQRIGEMGRVQSPMIRRAEMARSEDVLVDVSTRSVGELVTSSWKRRYSTLVMIVAPLVMCVVLVLLKSRCFTIRQSSAAKVSLMEDDCHSDYGSVSF